MADLQREVNVDEYIILVNQKIKNEKKICTGLKEYLNEIFVADEKEKTFVENLITNLDVLSKNERSSRRLNEILKYFHGEMKKIYDESKLLRIEEERFAGFLKEYEFLYEDMIGKVDDLKTEQSERNKAVSKENKGEAPARPSNEIEGSVKNKRRKLDEILVKYQGNKLKDLKAFFQKYILTVLRFHSRCSEIYSKAFNYLFEEHPEIDIEQFVLGRTEEEINKFVSDYAAIDLDKLKYNEQEVKAKRAKNEQENINLVYNE